MAVSTRVATINPPGKVVWKNVHLTVTQTCSRYYTIELPQPGDGSKIVEDMGACATALQAILKDAVAAGQRLRCIGGGWSLSDAAVTNGWLIDTLSMNLYWTMEHRQIDAKYKHKDDIARLYLVQAGVTVQDLNDIVESDGMAITTSGASNGQTIAGAVATGTHGSAFQYGSMSEFVVGIHLVAGTGKILWLERASYPVVSAAFAAQLGAELKREDDDLFNAALVSFGSFGIIAGLMIETEPKYLFEAQRIRLPLNDHLRSAMDTMKFDDLPLPHPAETPWHFEITFNPHDIHGGGFVRTLYKYPYTGGYTKPVMPFGALGPGEGLLGIIGTISNALTPATVALAADLLIRQNLPLYGPLKGTSAEIFSLTTLEGRAMSMELGIAMEDSSRVLDLLLGLHPEIDVYLGVISYRWVKQTTAMLGFTRFPVTATIEFNASYNNRTLAYYNRIWAELSAQGIPFTLHWGQMNNFTPESVRKMYGTLVDKWMAARDGIMTAATKAVFTSRFLESTGLG